MPRETMKYSNDEITVVWKPAACIHSTRCWKGLISVFDPREKPWVKMDGATTAQIISQVQQCPSGALSYFRNDGSSDAVQPVQSGNPVPAIEITANGPYLIKTACKLIHADGKEESKEATIALCRCGASGNKPYCDGSHKSNGFKAD